MSWVDGARQRVRMLFRRQAVERELTDELEFHLEQEAARHRAAGMAPDDAQRRARLALGVGQRVREEVRDEWSPRFASGLGADVRDGLRQLARRPGFSAVAVLTLALGMGANTAIFSLVRSVLIEPLPYRDPGRLAMVWEPDALEDETWLSVREYVEYARAVRTFDRLGAYTDFAANLTEDGEPERVVAASMTATVFGILGVAPSLGRVFGEAEDLPGADGVVVLGDRLWRQRFGGRPEVIGTSIRVNGRPRTVVGVMPPGFRLPMDYRADRPAELWVPLAVAPGAEMPWGDRSYHVVGRLREGVSLADGSAEVARITGDWARQGVLGAFRPDFTRVAVSLDTLVLGGVRPALVILFGAVGLVLLIACANVAHLLLARSDVRRREIATRAALGASRRRIARQLFAESAVLGGLGAAIGVAVGYGGLQAVLAFTPVQVIQARRPDLDLAVLGYTALLAIVTAVLAGLAPALQMSRVDVGVGMGSVRGEGARAQRRTRRALIAFETALAVVLVIGAGLLTRSFGRLQTVEVGFVPRHVLTARIDLSGPAYADEARVVGFYEELLDRIARLPGVEAAGATRLVPLTAQIGNWTITVDDPALRDRRDVGPDWQIVTPGYVEAAGLELVEGRTFAAGDDRTSPLVALVSETMARQLWPGRSALGGRFHLGTRDQPWLEVVGVVGDVRHNAVVEQGRLEMYLLHSQWVRAQGGGSPRLGMSLVVRTAGDPMALLPAVRAEVGALDPAVPVSEPASLDQVLSAALARPRFTTALLGVFAGLALLLAAIGLYAMMSYTAARRTNEIGIRMALGARPRAVARLVVTEALMMTAAGLAVGLLVAGWATRFLASELYLIGRLDPWTFGGVPLLLLAISAVASYLPARRAARVSPLEALRSD